MKQDNESDEIQPKRWLDLHYRDNFTSGCNHWGDLLDHLRSCAKRSSASAANRAGVTCVWSLDSGFPCRCSEADLATRRQGVSLG